MDLGSVAKKTCHICFVATPEIFAQTQGSNYWQPCTLVWRLSTAFLRDVERPCDLLVAYQELSWKTSFWERFLVLILTLLTQYNPVYFRDWVTTRKYRFDGVFYFAIRRKRNEARRDVAKLKEYCGISFNKVKIEVDVKRDKKDFNSFRKVVI